MKREILNLPEVLSLCIVKWFASIRASTAAGTEVNSRRPDDDFMLPEN